MSTKPTATHSGTVFCTDEIATSRLMLVFLSKQNVDDTVAGHDVWPSSRERTAWGSAISRQGTRGSTLPMTDFNIAQPMPMLVVFLVTSMMTARPFLMVLAKW